MVVVQGQLAPEAADGERDVRDLGAEVVLDVPARVIQMSRFFCTRLSSHPGSLVYYGRYIGNFMKKEKRR